MANTDRNRFVRRTFGLLVALLLGLAACQQSAPAPKEEPLATRPEQANPDDWCVGHAVPESMCTKCHKKLIARYKEAGDYCEEHGFPESVCPICHPLAPPGGTAEARGADEHSDEAHAAAEPTDGAVDAPFEKGTVIRFAAKNHAKIAGIATTVATRSPVGLSVRAPATIEFDRDAVAEVRAPVRGIVREVVADLGARVEAGDPLFVLASAEVGDLQAAIRAAREEAETARANHERQVRLARDGIASTRKVELARQQAQSAQSRLASVQSSLRFAGAGGRNGELVVRAPIAGTVVRRPAVMGTSAEPSTPLATIADASRMWALIDVAERQVGLLSKGQPVTLEIDGSDGPATGTATGTVTWISPEIDPRTRTVSVRAELDNPNGRLRANQFAEAVIGIAPREDAVVVPVDAVQRLDDVSVAFVEKSSGLYEPRVVKVGLRTAEHVEIRGGIEDGERVVSTGAFVLKTELSKDSIGAGCCEVPAAGAH